MSSHLHLTERFEELAKAGNQVPNSVASYNDDMVNPLVWAKWSTSAGHLIELALGNDSIAYTNFTQLCDEHKGYRDDCYKAVGVFLAAKEDFACGLTKNIETKIAGEIFGDFIVLAKSALAEGHKDVAAVLACAALEDALKRFASLNGLDLAGKSMDSVVGALKSARLVQGAQKSLLDAMPRVRNCAMHADWEKITEPDVNSVIGFVESFLQTKF